jgi:GH35 family endo-1,4-beta-xylanase
VNVKLASLSFAVALLSVWACAWSFCSAASQHRENKKSIATLSKLSRQNLVAEPTWVLGDNSKDGSLIYQRDNLEVVPNKDRGKRPLLLRHSIKFENALQKTKVLHVHLQAKSDKEQDIGIEILVPKYPYPHALSETRKLASIWQTFDFDSVIGDKDKADLSLFLKLRRDGGAVHLKDISVVPSTLSALGINANDLSDAGISRNIEKIRKEHILIEVLNDKGKGIPGVRVRIFQNSKKFLFGTEIQGLKPSDSSKLQQTYQNKLLSVFNFATVTPYWPQVEKVKGQPDYKPFDEQIAWLASRKYVIKLTPAFWPHWPPEFLPEEPADAEPMVMKNLHQFMTHFGPMPVTFLENNEVAAALTDPTSNGLVNWVRAEGAVKVLNKVTETERASLDPERNQQLICNDYEGGQTEFDMLDQLQKDHKLPDAIGIEMHMTQGEWPLERVAYIIQKLSKYCRPLYVSEISIISGDHRWVQFGAIDKNWFSTTNGEMRQADYVEKLYKLLFSNKYIYGITWWDLSDKDAWQGAPRGLLRGDMTAKPAFLRLQNLISEKWQSNQVCLTDKDGKCDLSVFKGNYTISIVNPERRLNAGDNGIDVTVSNLPEHVGLRCRAIEGD